VFLQFFDRVNRAVLDGAQSQEDVIRRVDEGAHSNTLK